MFFSEFSGRHRIDRQAVAPPAGVLVASGLKQLLFRLIRRKRAPEVFKAWLPYPRIYFWDVIINVRLALPRETEPSSAEVLAWQGISRSPAFPCKSGTPMVLSVPGEPLFVRDAFLNDHWIREPCLVCPQVSLNNYQGRILSAFIEGIHFPFNQGTPIWQSPPRNVRQNRQNPIRPVTSASQLG
ncbi:hypothetical protein CA85_35060 [Allorhodopirellula solitaria]|uniref:Uncharacterized protein n=1 Tax=Allorhodopirellula solitaria TaxID=2527987 RepID=A0A5C5XQG0_9BACT|nr:hypothetical protein CA85_35060 [Allorhodopirellula solitaria]